jgi:serine/threonine protein kinase
MTSGRYPDEADPEGLYTSEDLFGDIVDAPLEEPEPRRPAVARKSPIRVQVNEPVRPGEEEPVAAVESPVLPEDVAELLDAFADPAQARAPAPSAAADPERHTTEPEPAAIVKSAREAPIREEDAERLLAVLDAAGPGSGPASADPQAPAKPPRKTPADEADRLLAELQAGSAPAPPPVFREEKLASLLAELEPPLSHRLAKFQAASPKGSASAAEGVDLAAVAEDALGLARTLAEVEPAGAAPPADAAPEPAGVAAAVQYGPYRLLERVAVGGMAEVFKAKRSGVEGFEKVVAVKRILPHLSDNKEFVDMFVDEAKVVAGLAHPNIVQIFDLGKLEKSYYIAMEYVHGRDLRSIQKRAAERGLRVPLDLSVLIVSKVCAALEYAHRKRDDEGRPMLMVHRDISPQNILISFEGDVKLTDFGIAKAATKATTTDRGALRGKLLYMSPEQAWGKPIDRRSDLFSLGIVCYELLTDAKPFLGSSEMSILEMVRECRVAAPGSLNPRIPQSLERVVMKALERDAEVRYQDAGELGKDLERVLLERRPPAAPDLARLMELLFDEGERGVAQAAEQRHAEPSGVARLEVELEGAPAGQGHGEPDATLPPVPREPLSVEQLLKRFGKK